MLNQTDFDVEKIRLQLKRWQEKLLDVSKGNPLLGLNRTRAAKLKLKDSPSLDIFQKLVVEEGELRLPFVKKINKTKAIGTLFDPEEAEEEKENYEIEEGDLQLEVNSPIDLRRKLRRIYDNSHLTVEERGVVTLYTTLGVIYWNDDVLGDSVSPILLIPCELVSKGPNAALRLRMTDDEIQINPAIIYYFREKHKIDLPEITTDKGVTTLDQASLKVLFEKIEKNINEQGWKVSDEVWLGTFSFESLVLYQDLKLLTKSACLSPLIAAFAHASKGNNEASEALNDDLDSLSTPELIPVPVLPVDSSQLKALAYGASGKHVVIHGPPGTGKSQTISNIIADALGKNKKVLFVSAKMAALNVVFNRLKEEGLGEFCLEAHGIKAGKLKIIEELKRTIESEDSNNVGPLEQELENLQRTRTQLNDYVNAIHAIHAPLGISVFQAIGRFTKLQKTIDIKSPLPWENVLEVSMDTSNLCLDALASLSQMAKLFDTRKTHPWAGFVSLDFSLQSQEKVERDLKFLSQNFTDINEVIGRLKNLLPEQNLTFNDLSNLIPALSSISKVKKLPIDWWKLEMKEIKEKEATLKEAYLLAKEYANKNVTHQQVSNLSHEDTVELLQEVNGIFKLWYRRFTIPYFKWQTTVKQKLAPNTRLGYKNIQNYYATAKRLLDIEDFFKQKSSVLGEEMPVQEFKQLEVLENVINRYEAAILLREALPNYRWINSEVTLIDSEISKTTAALVSNLNHQDESIRKTAEKINGLWPNGLVNGYLMLQTPLLQLVQRANEVLINLDKFREWVLLQTTIKHCEDLNLGSFLESTGNISASELPSVFEKRFLTLWIDRVVSKTQCLTEFSSLKQQELIEKFRILDGRIRRLVKMHIKASAAVNSRKVKSAQFGLGNGSEVGILRFEMQKRKRIKPLRKLFSEIPHVLQALKPCMLMSPISVSTYLKPETFHFDLVIFDEASQLPTAEAVPSILRADQVIVAGDPNQLPPTSFFNTSLIGEDNEDFEEELFQTPLESLLDDCVASVPVFQEAYLKWHYRSRDERLINFSNHYFYDNKLITFPSADTNNDGRGISLEYIADGIWDRGKSRTNRREARRAAQLAIDHFKKFPEKSLGIVALNTYQREAIEDALNEELLERPELLPFFDSSRQEAFFIKSLESVQGDERDVMIISVGYGKNADGSLTLNFGPLNMEGGWRRLNVLITRAKWQVILLTSLRSAELHRVNPQNRGAIALKNYIEYAEKGGSLPPDPAQVTEGETDDFEDAVRVVLLERGYVVDAQVGARNFRIDLAIRDPKDSSKYLIGVECDGATYHSSRVARDRDLLREEILRNMGWRLYRVWSTEWFQNRDATIKLMLDNIERALSLDPMQSMLATALPEDKEYNFKPLPVPRIIRKYKPGTPYCKSKRRINRELLMLDKNISHFKDILLNIIDYEDPIHEDILDERLKEVFGVQKIGVIIRANIKKSLVSLMRNNLVEHKKSFVWIKDEELKTFRIPGDNMKRPIRYISPQEISLAILYLVEDQFGIIREEIPHAVAKVFEVARTDPEEIDRIRDITDELIEKKQLVANGIRVNLP